MPDSAITQVAAFAGLAAILVLTPGVGTAFLTATIVVNGRKAGYLAALGLVLGALLHAILAAIGTAVLLRRFPNGLEWIALAGGGYIVLLGLRALTRAVWPSAAVGATSRHGAGRGFVAAGALIALGNAPLPLFYLVVVPQYIPDGSSRLAGAALLSAIHLTLAGLWMATLVQLVGRAAEVLKRPRILLSLQLATGLVLVLLGLKSIAGASSIHP